MADTAVAAAALPITTALGDVPFGFLEWVAYDSITGQLVTTSTDMVRPPIPASIYLQPQYHDLHRHDR